MGVKVDDNFTGGNGQKAEEREPDSGGDAGQQQKRPKSASTLLVELALDRYEFGCTEDGKPFAVRPGGHVVRMLRGGKNSLRAELSPSLVAASSQARFSRSGRTAKDSFRP